MTNKTIFVFGSNRQGRHGAGAARHAHIHHSAKYGHARGLQGTSYAIVTKELRPYMPPVTLEEIEEEVEAFLAFARENPHLTFNVTRIGCGLAGFKDEQIAPMFKHAPANCQLPVEWQELFKKRCRA